MAGALTVFDESDIVRCRELAGEAVRLARMAHSRMEGIEDQIKRLSSDMDECRRITFSALEHAAALWEMLE